MHLILVSALFALSWFFASCATSAAISAYVADNVDERGVVITFWISALVMWVAIWLFILAWRML